MSHPLTNEIKKKLEYLLGKDKAASVTAEILSRAGLTSIESPDDAYRFALVLMRRGGLLEAAGRAIKIQAILNGARDTDAA